MAAQHRVLITGASGLLGRAIFKEFSNSDKWDVLGLAYSRATGGLKKLNLLDFDETKRFVKEFKPHILIHAAAERRPDVVENDEETSLKMNVGVTETLASIISELNSDLGDPEHFMLYLSTDYVFDGKSPPYQPSDEPNPLNKYGKSKLAGEQVMEMCHPNGGILRVPILYGAVEYLKESAVTVLLEALKQTDKPTKMDDYQIRYPTLVDDVAKVCRFIAEKRLGDKSMTGTWHWSGRESMTKYSMVLQMAEMFGLSHSHLFPNPNPPTGTPRPHNTALSCSELESLMDDGGASMRTPFQQGIKQSLQPFI
ncbi:methionine adenosyltransferase 2 subunit beta-like [Montipora capricornis]|uniref:methionine adenosyltransferase 2 subunit beta-like n=1 Tax=Montipora capricornis TaxID=246305 RepID=UPI0035F18FB0